MTQTLSRNFLQVRQFEFKQATKVLQRKRLRLGPALLAYEGGFLSIESGEVTVVMHAEGEWHGRATFMDLPCHHAQQARKTRMSRSINLWTVAPLGYGFLS